MINVSVGLKHFDFSTTSVNLAIQQVRLYIEDHGDPITHAANLLHVIFGFDESVIDHFEGPVANPASRAIAVTQAMVEQAIKADCMVEDVNALLTASLERVEKYINKPGNSCMFATAADQLSQSGEVQVVTEKVDVKVEVREDGKIKKGGKQVLAAALYEKYVINVVDKPTNQWFKQLLIDELGMTSGGATTYAYNCDAQHKMLVKEGRAKKVVV